MKKTSSEVETLVVQMYLQGIKLKDIEELTNCKSIKHILKRNNIKRKRTSKECCTHKKEDRNKKLIENYLDGDLTILQICKKYKITDVNLYRILKLYNIKTDRKSVHHWTIHQKLKETPNIKCKFYILENYYGHTKIGITTKSQVKERYNKNVNVFYEIEDSLENCYNIEFNLKKKLKFYRPNCIKKTIDGWSECYSLNPENILEYVKSFVREPASV